MKKKFLAALLILALALSMAACGSTATTAPAADAAATEAPAAEAPVEDGMVDSVESEADLEKSEGVMSYAEYAAAELDSEVVIEAYVQANQSWWDNKVTVYAADADGAYFIYELACTEEQMLDIIPGQKIKVTGYKSEWSGEVEIVDASFEVEDGYYIAEAVDLTDVFGTDELIDYQNRYFSVTGATVVPSKIDGDDTEYAFLYSWDGSGTHDGNSDLYFNVEINGETYQFTVESYLCGNDSEVYAAVEGLEVGDTIDIMGFLYWYNGANPHVVEISDSMM